MAEWQPIETAPLDRESYLFFSPGNRWAGNHRARKGYIQVDHYHPRQSTYDIEKRRPRWLELPDARYTHWMPLPETPEEMSATRERRQGADLAALRSQVAELLNAMEPFAREAAFADLSDGPGYLRRDDWRRIAAAFAAIEDDVARTPEEQKTAGVDETSQSAMADNAWQSDSREEDRAKLAGLRRQIDEYPGWGAGLAALAEEHDAIARRLGEPLVRRAGGEPMAD